MGVNSRSAKKPITTTKSPASRSVLGRGAFIRLNAQRSPPLCHKPEEPGKNEGVVPPEVPGQPSLQHSFAESHGPMSLPKSNRLADHSEGLPRLGEATLERPNRYALSRTNPQRVPHRIRA